jgi:hypothetical protein
LATSASAALVKALSGFYLFRDSRSKSFPVFQPLARTSTSTLSFTIERFPFLQASIVIRMIERCSPSGPFPLRLISPPVQNGENSSDAQVFAFQGSQSLHGIDAIS